MAFAWKATPLWPELIVSMGPRPHLSFCACKTGWFSPAILNTCYSQPSSVVLCVQNCDISIRIPSLYGSQPSSAVFACKTATLGPELRVSMGPSPHLWFLCIHNSDIMTCINSLYVSRPSPVVLWMQNNVISIRMTCLYGSQLSFVFFGCKTASLGQELQVSMGPRPHLCFLHSKQRL